MIVCVKMLLNLISLTKKADILTKRAEDLSNVQNNTLSIQQVCLNEYAALDVSTRGA